MIGLGINGCATSAIAEPRTFGWDLDHRNVRRGGYRRYLDGYLVSLCFIKR